MGEVVIVSHEAFYKHIGCRNAEVFKEANLFINILSNMLITGQTSRDLCVFKDTSHEFMDFIDGNGFKVTQLDDTTYRVEIIK